MEKVCNSLSIVMWLVFFTIYWLGSYKLSYSTCSFTFIFILFLLFEINAFVGARSNLPVRSAVAFGKPRIFVTVTMSRPLIGRKHKETQSSPRSSASILKFKRIKMWVCEINIKFKKWFPTKNFEKKKKKKHVKNLKDNLPGLSKVAGAKFNNFRILQNGFNLL